jgi:beta-glucuronidase
MRRVLWFIALQLVAAAALGDTRIDLNRGWSLIEQKKEWVPLLSPTHIPGRAEIVDLPHTWNRAGSKYDLLGSVWYLRRFDLPKLPADSIVQLHIGAAFYKARVFVNGESVGEHEGGHHEFSFDIAPYLKETNIVAVLVDNQPGMFTIPGFGARGAKDAWYDWWAYGGITRDVWIDIHGPVRIAGQFIRTTMDGFTADVANRITLVRRTAQPIILRATVTSPTGKEVGTRTIPIGNDATSSTIEIGIDKPELWDLDHARLYRMNLEVLDTAGKVIASASERFGIRAIALYDRKLFINGERVRLTGMTRHSDSPWEGAAETRGTLLHDWEDMKSLNMTLTRPVHYAPDPVAFDFADERGILLIPEIPIWQASEEQLSNPQYLELAKRQFRELIEQFGNHPSVFAWSVLNESAAGTPGGIRFFREMRDYIKSLDPQRFVTLADDNLPKLARADESAANDADFLMMNQYFGAWHGPREALGPALDKVDRLFPDKMVIISELGFPGIFAPNPIEADKMRVSILREQMPLLAQRNWIGGAILWCYQDYKSRRYFWPGQEGGYLEHGIVDADRQRKPSYFAWAELNAPARLDMRWTKKEKNVPAAFEIAVTPNGAAQMPHFPLRGYTVIWQLRGAESRAFASGSLALDAAGSRVATGVPAREKPTPFDLVVRLMRPDGTVAMERALAAQ